MMRHNDKVHKTYESPALEAIVLEPESYICATSAYDQGDAVGLTWKEGDSLEW